MFWATNCAEHLLPAFKEKQPKDDRPRKAVEAGHAWVRGKIAMGEARAAVFVAHAANYAATATNAAVPADSTAAVKEREAVPAPSGTPSADSVSCPVRGPRS